jgi:TPR repeat protein
LKPYLFIIFSFILATLSQAGTKNILPLMDQNNILMSLTNSCPADLFVDPEQQYQDFIGFCGHDMDSCFAKCVEGSASHCFGLANNLESTELDPKYSERLFSLACSKGLVTACTNRASGIMRHNPENKACYVRSFELTCKKEDPWGCTMYGFLLARGIGIDKNHELALKVLKVGCTYGVEDPACKNALAIEQEIKGAQPEN